MAFINVILGMYPSKMELLAFKFASRFGFDLSVW